MNWSKITLRVGGYKMGMKTAEEKFKQSQAKIMELSKGNPGAINVLCMLILQSTYDFLSFFEQTEIKGDKIYLLFKDVCKSNTRKLQLLAASYNADLISLDVINASINHVAKYGQVQVVCFETLENRLLAAHNDHVKQLEERETKG